MLDHRFALLLLICFKSVLLGVADECAVVKAIGLTVEGLADQGDYNGEYNRGAQHLNLNGQPTFWQKPTSPEGTCGHSFNAKGLELLPGDCAANAWVTLPTGHDSAAACFQACEAERINGCCRWGPRSPAESGMHGCAIGHGRAEYKEGKQFAASQGANVSVITRCAGRAFIFFCSAKGNWNMAPPSAWDVIDNGGCFDTATGAYYHSVVLGSAELKAGFTEEWAWKNTYGHYAKLQAPVKLSCKQLKSSSESAKGTEGAAAKSPSKSGGMRDIPTASGSHSIYMHFTFFMVLKLIL